MPVDFIPDSQTAKRIDFIPDGDRAMLDYVNQPPIDFSSLSYPSTSTSETINEETIPNPFFKQDYIPKSSEERAALDLAKSEQTGLFPSGEQSPSPVFPFAKGLNFLGKVAEAGLADLGSELTGQTIKPDENVPSNISALISGEPLPAETQLKTLPTPLRIVGSASQGLVESTPKLAAITALQATGVPAPVAAAAIFGSTEQGFDPKQAAIAAALPFVGKYGGQLSEAIASKAGITPDKALAFINGAGSLAAASAYLATIQTSEIANLPPEQRKDAIIEAISNQIGQAMLGPMGMERLPKEGKIPVTWREIQPAQPIGETYAVKTGQKPTSSITEYTGTSQGKDIRANAPEVRSQEGAEAINRNSLNEGGIKQPTAIGTRSPEQVAAMSDAEYMKVYGSEGRKYGPTDDATVWAMKNPYADVSKLEALRDKQTERQASGESTVERTQWFSDAIHALKKDEVGLMNIATMKNRVAGVTQPPSESSLPAEAVSPAEPAITEPAKANVSTVLGNVKEPEMALGPGAKTSGEPKYAAIQQLTDQLKANPAIGVAPKLTWSDKLVDTLTRGKGAVTRSIGKMIALKGPIRDLARGVRDIPELDKEIGKLDFLLQQSSGRSMQAKTAMKEQFKNQTVRDAAILWIDSGGDDGVAAIRDALTKLPPKTSARVKRAMEMAANLPPEARDFAESLRQYWGIRGNDALESGVMEKLLEDYATHIWKKESDMPEELRAAIANGRVSTYFQFAKQRKIGSFLEGILQGKTPELDAAEIIPYYNYQLDKAIASREFIHNATENLTEKDGRPTFAPSGVRSAVGKGETPDALMINPRAKGTIRTKGSPETVQEEATRLSQMNDYRQIDHPAMRKWKWAATDENGSPIFYQADLLVHPDAYERIARMMDRGRLTPTNWGRMALSASTQVKGAKLGLFSLFHPVHVMSHAAFHWTNPFRVFRDSEINWDSPQTRLAVEKGHVKLAPNPHELAVFSEGILQPGLLVHKIPFIGAWSRAQSEWTFTKLIPKLKLDTFNNAYARAIWMRDNLGFFKGLTEDQIAARTGDSVNNAFGELNHQFLGKYGRDPRFQRLLRGIFLAPDFGEARLRFAEKTFTRYGHEERLAIATMFVTMYTLARVANHLSHNDPEWDWKRAFEVKMGNHWWSMRSVVSDADRALADIGRFMYVRLNPLYARTASDILIGRDPSGQRLTTTQKFITRPLEQFIPIQLGALTRDDQKLWESFITSMGVQAFRDSPVRDIHQMISDFKKNSSDPKLRNEWERSQKETFGQSDYAPMRYALEQEDIRKANQAYLDLIKKGHSAADIAKAMNPNEPFTRSYSLESKFKKSLDANGLKLYQQAREQQKVIYERFKAMRQEFKSANSPQSSIGNYFHGQTLSRGGINYRVSAFDRNMEPLVEEANA